MTGKHFAHFKWVQWKKVDHFQRKSLLLLAFKSIMPVFLYPQKWPHDRNKQPLLWLLTLRSESVCSRSPIWSSIPILMVSRVSLTRFAVVTGWRGYCPISNREPINFEQIRISSPVNFDHNKTRSQVGGFFFGGQLQMALTWLLEIQMADFLRFSRYGLLRLLPEFPHDKYADQN